MKAARPTLTERLVALAHSNGIIPVLLMVEILETTILPFPYEAAFIALCFAAPKRIGLFVAVTVIGSAIAGTILYALGAGFADPLADRLGVEAAVDSYKATFQERGGVLIFLGGLTPVPSYLVNLAAGASGYPYPAFVALFAASRFIRFAAFGLLIHFFGERVLGQWTKLPSWLRKTLIIGFLIGVTLWSIRAVT